MNLRKLLPAAFVLAAGPPLFAGSTAAGPTWGWLPPNVNSGYGDTTDKLYLAIMWVVGIAFFLTEGALLFFIVAYRSRPGHKATYVHGSRAAELTWTIVPCGILIWLAVYQYDAWRNIREKMPSENDPKTVTVQVYPEQFQWNFRYVSDCYRPDGTLDKDASYKHTLAGMLHVPINRKVYCKMSSKDVIHSFFIPFARVKQDVVPGMLTKAWFEIDRIPVWKVARWTKRQMKDANGKMESYDAAEGDSDAPFGGLVLLTESEFNAANVALPQVWSDEGGGGWRTKLSWSSAPRRDGGEANENGIKDYFYTALSKKTLFRHNGQYAEGETTKATCIYHHLEIACAELCGLGHTTMRGVLYPETEDMYERFMAEKAKYGRSTEAGRFENIWDEQYDPKWNQRDK